MTSVGIIHPDLTAKGGAESVSMEIIEALDDQYDVDLLTITNPSLAELNDYYNTEVDTLDIRRTGRVTRWSNAILDGRFINLSIPRFRLLELALFNRFISRVQSEYDLVISTYNEYSLETPCIQYIHHPNYYLWLFPGSPDIGRMGELYIETGCRLGGFAPESLSSATLISNSRWTAEEFAEIYDTRPDVLYPPVDTTGFSGRPWSDRENGFVIISRISPDKGVHRGIEIVDRLVERGHDIHLHVVGSIISEEYHEQILTAADGEHVHIEGELPREELVELVNTHRYGLHTKSYEHFGIAVAELVAGGTIPFVPDSGGQREIVDREELTYGSIEEGVERIEHVLESREQQNQLRTALPDVEERFGRERFRRQIRAVIKETLVDCED